MTKEDIITISKFNIYKGGDKTKLNDILNVLFTFTMIIFTMLPIYLWFFSFPFKYSELSYFWLIIYLIFGLCISFFMIALSMFVIYITFFEEFYEYKSKTILQNYIETNLITHKKNDKDSIIITSELIQTLFEIYLRDRDKEECIKLLNNTEIFITSFKSLIKNHLSKDIDVNISNKDLKTLKIWIKLMKLNSANLIAFNEQFKLIIENNKLVIVECINNVKKYYNDNNHKNHSNGE